MHRFVLFGALDSATRKTERIVIRPALSRDLMEYAGVSPGPNHRATDPNPPMFVDDGLTGSYLSKKSALCRWADSEAVISLQVAGNEAEKGS